MQSYNYFCFLYHINVSDSLFKYSKMILEFVINFDIETYTCYNIFKKTDNIDF